MSLTYATSLEPIHATSRSRLSLRFGNCKGVVMELPFIGSTEITVTSPRDSIANRSPPGDSESPLAFSMTDSKRGRLCKRSPIRRISSACIALLVVSKEIISPPRANTIKLPSLAQSALAQRGSRSAAVKNVRCVRSPPWAFTLHRFITPAVSDKNHTRPPTHIGNNSFSGVLVNCANVFPSALANHRSGAVPPR